jgi:CDP-diglyceride synthetase
MKRKVNVKLVVFSLIALVFVALSFFVSWYFLIGAVILVILNQIEINKMKRGTKKKLLNEKTYK